MGYESEVVMRAVTGGEGVQMEVGVGGVGGGKEAAGSEYMLMPAQRGGQGVFSSDEVCFVFCFLFCLCFCSVEFCLILLGHLFFLFYLTFTVGLFPSHFH